MTMSTSCSLQSNDKSHLVSTPDLEPHSHIQRYTVTGAIQVLCNAVEGVTFLGIKHYYVARGGSCYVLM